MAGSVRRHSDGWIADVTVDGVRRTRKAKTKAEAQALKRLLLEQLMARPTGPGNGITLQEARALSLRVRWQGLAYERTAAIYSQAVLDHFGPDTQLGAINAPMVQEWRQKLMARGNRPDTINKKISAIRAMMADAVLHGRLDAIPPLPRQLTRRNTKDRVFTSEEVTGFCTYFRSIGQPAAADLLVFLLHTCCRWGEAEKLKGQDVDLVRGMVTFWSTKNGRPRSVPLTRGAIDAVTPYMPHVPGHRVWPYSYATYRWHFSNAKEALGLAEDEALTIHTTRHTCASRLANRGISQGQLMAFGGWESLQAVQRYMHMQTGALAACVAALEEEQ
jgi:integrase